MSLTRENDQIRELREMIEDLEGRCDDLEDELNRLKRSISRIDDLEDELNRLKRSIR